MCEREKKNTECVREREGKYRERERKKNTECV